MTTTTTAVLREASRSRSAADFPGTIEGYYPYWDAQYRPYLIMAVEAFPADRLDWKPLPTVFTARQVILHIAEAERWWIGHIVEGGPYEDWVVPAADPAEGWQAAYDAPDRDSLLELLAECQRPTQRWLARPVSQLCRVIAFQPKEGAERLYTLHWILDHLQEHEIHHRAQLNLYLRLMGSEAPSI